MIEIVGKTDVKRRGELLARIKERAVALDAELMQVVTNIIDDVRARGDAALVEYTHRFDDVRLQPSELRVKHADLAASAAHTALAVKDALREAMRRIRLFHEHERRESWEMKPSPGVRIGQRILPVAAAGLYVPGGTASYPSSVVMNVVPARVAGVERLAVVTPPRTLQTNPAVAFALLELGVEEIYQVGGAQSIAALAYGTETIPSTDVITGPGNKYVAAAKKLVFGKVGIDSIAGPSEVVIIADASARADYIAADLLAQAEHGTDASAILVTTSDELAQQTKIEIERQTASLPRGEIARASINNYGAIFVVEIIEEACELVNTLAPEHLEIIAGDEAGEDEIARNIKHAGAIFLGAHTPEAVGDYFAGPNHVLPTSGAARFASALSVNNFVRQTSILRFSPSELNQTASKIAALAEAEGLTAHARSALIRLDESVTNG